ncbi:hypothetical protein N7516_010935 [Penicillium verrucosum]|uniref:uncharacterized protein n=1 Tax=Penicillium verrucosum TaxID=60171 RepID=UPI0025455879|nr:uncharacterized protein N7516_010935 [Penicillium verrucosum]KAJ5920077.1 hypothetical protein N7516_010935 [Penicillium verrucosum]
MTSRPPVTGHSHSWFEHIAVATDTNVDIVAVPPIGAHHRKTWIAHGATSWLDTELLRHIPRARVLLYKYGDLRDDKIDTLGERLLNQLRSERKHESTSHLFICHSTGGLVVKAALALASREPSQSILTSCHGIAFFATPHQGSTYLSADEYAASIRHLLHLEHETPAALRKQLRPRQERLWHLSNQFKTLSADMKVWSFLETVDSTMCVVDAETNNVLEFHVPITSIRSGLLDIEHEQELPMATDHTGTASFHGQESTRDRFLQDLDDAVDIAVEISKREDTPLGVEQKVMVQINGFFEDTALGLSDETPLKLWSTTVSLEDYLSRGPSVCLRERLGRVQPSGVDDSSISSFDSPRSSYIAPGSDPHDHHHDHPDEKPRPLRAPLPYRRSFDDPSGPSPKIHITEAEREGYLNDSRSDTPPPEEQKRKSSLTKALGLIPLKRSHRRSASDSSSQGSIERPPSSSSTSQPVQSPFLAIPKSTRDRINQNADIPDIPRAVPRFDRPEADTEKLMWIHVPYTHTGWVSQVIRRACQDRQEPNFVRKFINDENWYLRLNRARHLEPHARFVKPACIHSRQMDIPQSPSDASEDPQLALYLHWDTYRNLIQRRKVVEDRLNQGRSRPVPGRISKASLEAQLIWTYLGCEPPVHFRRTLDQYGYPNLRSTIARDDDQMLWKRTRRPARIDEQLKEYLQSAHDDPENEENVGEFMDGNVLMVDQLWLWILDQKTVVTFFPNQEATTSEGKLFEQSNLHSSIYNELNGDLSRRFETAGDLAALIMLHAVTVLLDKTLNHDLQVLRIFEESISILTESVTKSFKRFRNRGFTNRPADHDRTSDGKIMTAAQQDYKELQVARRNREDLSVLLELRDIEDELSTILKLLEQQDAVINSMVKYFDNRGMRIDEYRSQINDMKENSHLTQKAVETLLDLKQKQANVDEAKMTRWQAEVAQTQSRAVMVFTIFSVVFLPLSFFTSLFGINAREWSGEQTNPTLGEMFEIAAPASFAIISLSLFVAFSDTLRDIVSKTHKIGVGLWKEFIVHPVKSYLWDSATSRMDVHVVPEDSELRKRFDEYLGYGRRNMQRDEDIWQRWQGGPIAGVKGVKREKSQVKPGLNRRGRGEV